MTAGCAGPLVRLGVLAVLAIACMPGGSLSGVGGGVALAQEPTTAGAASSGGATMPPGQSETDAWQQMAAAASTLGHDLGDRAIAELRARIRSMREPLRIVMVTYRGWTDTDQGFKDYFESHRIPVELTVLDAEREQYRLTDFVQEIKELHPDLVYTWGTAVTLGILGRYDTPVPEAFVRDIPAVFANVSYPVQSGLVPSLQGSGRAITGSTYLVPLEVQLRAIRSYRPLSVLGVIYNPKETNSLNVVEQLRTLAAGDDGFRLVERPVTLDVVGRPLPDSLPGLVTEVAQAGAEFLYIPPDSFLSRHKLALTAAAVDAHLPTFAAAEGTLEESRAMMGLISRYYNIGKLTAHLATRILVGQEDPASIPIASLARYSLVLNMDVIRELAFYPPIDLLQISEIEDSRSRTGEGSADPYQGESGRIGVQ